MNKKFKIVSLFCGCGGMDLGFEEVGFSIIWANDNNKKIEKTFTRNFQKTTLEIKPIQEIDINSIPGPDVIIGGPPCQSWSLAGAMRGINDERGRVFYNYVNIIKEKKPLAFVAENVKGILSKSHKNEFLKIIGMFLEEGYLVKYKLLNAKNFGVPQDRERVFIVGIRSDLNVGYEFPKETHSNGKYVTLKDAIWDLKRNPGEYLKGSFSPIYMSRNRKRRWDEVSFTIQAGGRHAPLYPDSPDMLKVGIDKRVFDPKSKNNIRRLSVRECARIQTFPDSFKFIEKYINEKYKMIGNAVPVLLAKAVAKQLMESLNGRVSRDTLF